MGITVVDVNSVVITG